MKNALYTFVIIIMCLGLGKLINHYIALLPASLYGMLIYCLLLQLRLVNYDTVSKANLYLIKHMGVFFVPAGVGIVNHLGLIQQHGLAIIAVIFISTFILLTLVGVLAEKLLISTKEPPAHD